MQWMVCYWLYGTDALDGTLVRQGWDGGTDVSRRWNRRATIGTGTGAQPFALEGWRAVVIAR